MADAKASDNKSTINKLFLSFRDSIDFHHDRRERVIKSSRDITALSKKLIYIAHRVTQRPLESILDEVRTKKSEILELFKKVSVELEGANFYRRAQSAHSFVQEFLNRCAKQQQYHIEKYEFPLTMIVSYKYNKSVSPSIQEYIEAIAFVEYLENGVLITKEKIENDFRDENGNQFLLITYDDYLLGIADLTGELMRYAINCIGMGDHNQARKVCQFLRNIKSGYDILRVTNHFLRNKVEIMKGSLAKVENEYSQDFYQHIISEHAQNFEVSMEVDE
ncbi:3075_t:CDS:2 [Acaulospora morrowiae]|uniref:3075_t:CDS:1 n=1 Tax=Acaulospora morrowiae TaxID=94023 RepID=A0A9N8WEK5_9GLOM|nr:3075_t:CDS:2 [Acaulospora morrowiae]